MTSGKTILGSKIAYLDPSELAREAAVARLGVPGAVSLPHALPLPSESQTQHAKGMSQSGVSGGLRKGKG
jgi:hypothetical protein